MAFWTFVPSKFLPSPHDLDHFSRHRGQWYVGISGACGAQRLAHDLHPRAHRGARAGQEAPWPMAYGLEVEFADRWEYQRSKSRIAGFLEFGKPWVFPLVKDNFG